MNKVRILHISDLHFRSDEGELPDCRVKQVRREAWRRERVLGQGWQHNLREIKDFNPPIDLVCCTGDVADWGRPEEYRRATIWIEDLLSILGVARERLFIVPGNHDIDQSVAKNAWVEFRQLAQRVHASDLSNWLAGGPVPLGVDESLRDKVLSRGRAWREWVEGALNRRELLPDRNHPYLGYRSVLDLSQPFPIHIIGLDSAWLAGDDNDAGKLLITEDQVGMLCSDEGRLLAGLRIALVHHPLSDCADGNPIRQLLAEHVDLLMRGHQHDPLSEVWQDPDRRLVELAAGCLYEGSEGHRYPNGFQIVDVMVDEAGRPLRYDIYFRSWSHRGFWHWDSSLYKHAQDGKLSIPVGRADSGRFPAEPRSPSSPSSRERQADARDNAEHGAFDL